jgi:hypothetical protein
MTVLCPQCRMITNMTVSFMTRAVTGADGRTKFIRIATYHCETCRSFVRDKEETLRTVV